MTPCRVTHLYSLLIAAHLGGFSCVGCVDLGGWQDSSPAAPITDRGFAHGGWSMPYFDPEAMGSAIDEVMQTTEALLFGRRTWQAMAAAGPIAPTISSTSTALMIEPVLLGGGKRVFLDDGVTRPLELISTTTAPTGVLICAYRPAGR